MTILISIISLVTGAFLAHYLAMTRMRSSELSDFKLAAYTDFIVSASRISVSRRLGKTDNEIDELARLNDAKNRILICRDVAVIEDLIDFWNAGSTLELEGGLLAFKRLSQSIRYSLGYKKNDLVAFELTDTMFKLEPSDYSFRAEQDQASYDK